MADDERPVQNPARIGVGGKSGGLFIDIRWPTVKERRADNKAVLLVHGASAGSRTFDQPNGGLRRYLTDNGWYVYSVDWRSSMLTANALLAANHNRQEYTLDGATVDLTVAVEWAAKHAGVEQEDLAVVGHCVGGGLVAQAIARGEAEERREQLESNRVSSATSPFKPRRIVLTTLALFWRVGVEGWFKGTDLVVDDVQSESQKELAMSAGQSNWEGPIEQRFQLWLESGLHHGCGIPFCQRICFMYGMPFRLADVEYIHKEEELSQQFGAMPLSIYVHCLQNLRRGWLAPFNAADNAGVLVDDRARERFADKRITLITGNENQVWHRDCMDRMFEWLRNGKPLNPEQRDDPLIVKHVLPKYGHQDLYWSTKAASEVYPLILKGLSPMPSGT